MSGLNTGDTPAKVDDQHMSTIRGVKHPTTMVPTKIKKTKPMKKYMIAGNETMGPKEDVTDEWNLVFKKGMFDTYHRILDMHRNTPSPQEALQPTHQGTKKDNLQTRKTIEGDGILAWMESDE